MKHINPRPSSGPRRITRVLFLLLGLAFTAWEARLLWRQLCTAIRKSNSRN
jgi:hypothetical protein